MILEAIERVLILNFDILTPFGGVPLEKMHFLFVSRRFWMIRSDSSSPEDSNKLSAVAFRTECPNQQKIDFKFFNFVAILICQLKNCRKLVWLITYETRKISVKSFEPVDHVFLLIRSFLAYSHYIREVPWNVPESMWRRILWHFHENARLSINLRFFP